MEFLERPSSLAVFATVAGSGVVGLLIYAGLFYANLRQTSSEAAVESGPPSFSSKEQAEQESKRWIEEGGTYTVTSRQRIRRSVPLTRQERRKLELLAEEKRRSRIEAHYEACLEEAASDLAKELCSFQQQPLHAGAAEQDAIDDNDIPTTKLVEDVRVQSRERPRRECNLVADYRRFNCVEFDVAENADVNPDQQSSLEIRTYRQFRY